MELTIKLEMDCSERFERVLNSVASSLVALTGKEEVKEKNLPALSTDSTDETPKSKKGNGKKKAPKAEVAPAVNNEESNPVEETPVEGSQDESENTSAHSEEEAFPKVEEMRKAAQDCKLRLMNGDMNSDPLLRKRITDYLKDKIRLLGAESLVEIEKSKRAKFIEYCGQCTLDDVNNAPF